MNPPPAHRIIGRNSDGKLLVSRHSAQELDHAWRMLPWWEQEELAEDEGHDLRVPVGDIGVPRPSWATHEVLLRNGVLGDYPVSWFKKYTFI